MTAWSKCFCSAHNSLLCGRLTAQGLQRAAAGREDHPRVESAVQHRSVVAHSTAESPLGWSCRPAGCCVPPSIWGTQIGCSAGCSVLCSIAPNQDEVLRGQGLRLEGRTLGSGARSWQPLHMLQNRFCKTVTGRAVRARAHAPRSHPMPACRYGSWLHPLDLQASARGRCCGAAPVDNAGAHIAASFAPVPIAELTLPFPQQRWASDTPGSRLWSAARRRQTPGVLDAATLCCGDGAALRCGGVA